MPVVFLFFWCWIWISWQPYFVFLIQVETLVQIFVEEIGPINPLGLIKAFLVLFTLSNNLAAQQHVLAHHVLGHTKARPATKAPHCPKPSPRTPTKQQRRRRDEMADDPTAGGGDRVEDVVRAEVSVPGSPPPPPFLLAVG